LKVETSGILRTHLVRRGFVGRLLQASGPVTAPETGKARPRTQRKCIGTNMAYKSAPDRSAKCVPSKL